MSRWQGLEASCYMSIQGKYISQERNECMHASILLPLSTLVQSRIHTHARAMLKWMGLPTTVNVVKKVPHRHTQHANLSYTVLHWDSLLREFCIKLTIKTNPHIVQLQMQSFIKERKPFSLSAVGKSKTEGLHLMSTFLLHHSSTRQSAKTATQRNRGHGRKSHSHSHPFDEDTDLHMKYGATMT